MEKYLIGLIKNNWIKCFNLALKVIFVRQISFIWKIPSRNSSTRSFNIFAYFPVCNAELCIKFWRRSNLSQRSLSYSWCIIWLIRPVSACFNYPFRETMLTYRSFNSEKDAFYLQMSKK